MKLRFSLGTLVATLVVFGGAVAAAPSADQPPQPLSVETAAKSAEPQNPTADAILQIAAVTEAAANIALSAQIVEPAIPAATAAKADLVETPAKSAAAPARQKPAGQKTAAATRKQKQKLTARSVEPPRTGARPRSGDPVKSSSRTAPAVQMVRAVGPREVGNAAWYGGRYVGRRTSSGERLDSVHPTAAHRTLPLNSLARVTNLDNGRSVIVRVTDRGPVSQSLVIDMSPKAAEQLDMKAAGIVPVVVEQVVAVPSDPK